jgi:hypothetical protein
VVDVGNVRIYRGSEVVYSGAGTTSPAHVMRHAWDLLVAADIVRYAIDVEEEGS